MIRDILQTIKHNKIWSAIIIALSIISFLISLNAFTNAVSLYTQVDMVKDTFKDSMIDNIYTLKIVNTNDNQAETITNIKNFVSSLDEEIYTGAFYETGEYFNELESNSEYIRRNQTVYKNTYRENSPEISEVIYVDAQLFNMIDTNITASMFEISNDEYLPVYVGYEYKNILPLETVLTLSRTNQKYIIKGYIQNEKWLNNDDFISFAPISLDNKFIIPFSELDKKDNITQESTNGKIFIYLGNNENNINKYIQEINTYAEENGIKLNITSVNELIDDYKNANQNIINSNIFLAIMVSVCAITSIISTISILVLMRKKEYGIKIAFGYTKKKIIFSLITEVITLEFCSALISYLMIYLKTLNDKSIFNEIYLQTLGSSSIIYMIIMLFVVCLLILILPLIIINHYEPSDLIRGGE